MDPEIGKWKFENGNARKENAKVLANAGENFRFPCGRGEKYDYYLLGDSPVTIGKFVRWLQSSQEPSYIFAS
jgi:hypothetical protein